MYADISFPISSYQVFTYFVPEDLESVVQIGARVLAPLGPRKKVHGIVVKLHPVSSFSGEIRGITSVLDASPIFDDVLWKLLNWISDYYLTPLGLVMQTALPDSLRRLQSFRVSELQGFGDRDRKKAPQFESLSLDSSPRTIQFTAEQQRVIDELESHLPEKRFIPHLLHGVTGSGKTEIYIHLARVVQDVGKTSLILLPEIALTPQIAGRFQSIFGNRVAIWHSRMTPAERAWVWKQISTGAFTVVVGARSAVFTPLSNLGLIVVDEEQEASYKQEHPAPRYHAREVALMRGKLSGALTLLSSATPSLESYYNSLNGKYRTLRLASRYGAKYPEVHIVNMIKERTDPDKVNRDGISRLLKEKIQDRLEKKEQIILLQNRRGFSLFIICRDCGYVETCKNCHISLKFHKVDRLLRCHYCNFYKSAPITCAECHSINLVASGIGTQKVEEHLKDLFPSVRIVRMDKDSTRRRGLYVKILQEFQDKRADILIGTQMIAKGLHFENVTLVGIINADIGLFLPDFRAGERTFQLIYQVAGRSGRGAKPGEVVIQTNNPDDPAIKWAAQLDLEKYYSICLEERRQLNYSPYSWMAKLEFKGKDEKNVLSVAESLPMNFIGITSSGLEILGPAPCPLEKIRGNYRVQILFKSPKEKDKRGEILHAFLKHHLVESSKKRIQKGVSYHVDVEPVSLL